MALARQGVVVVSGMAKGIDGISQEAALEAGGVSVAVQIGRASCRERVF